MKRLKKFVGKATFLYTELYSGKNFETGFGEVAMGEVEIRMVPTNPLALSPTLETKYYFVTPNGDEIPIYAHGKHRVRSGDKGGLLRLTV
jgi:hypothetical protein